MGMDMSKYIYVPLPRELVEEVDQLIGTMGYRSRAEIVKDAIRRLVDTKSTKTREEVS